MQNLVLLFYYLIFLTAVLGVGSFLKNWLKLNASNKIEGVVFDLALGSIFYSYVFHLLGALHLLYAPVLVTTYFIPLIWWMYKWLEDWIRTDRTLSLPNFYKLPTWQEISQPHVWTPMVGLAFVFIPLLPHLFLFPSSWDVLAYHLPLPKFYLSQHALPFTSWFAQTGFPIGIEALFGYGEALHEPRLANFIQFTYLIATVVYLLEGLKYLFTQKTRWLATFLYLYQPMLYTEVSTSAFNDYPLAFFSLVMTVLVYKFYRMKKAKTFVAICIVASFLTLIKTSGLIMAVSLGVLVAPLLFNELKKKKLVFFKNFKRQDWVFCVLAGVPSLLWLVRNTLATGNPFYPFYNNLFKGLGYEAGSEEILHDIWRNSIVIKLFQNFWRSADTVQDYTNLAAIGFMFAGLIACIWFLKYKRQELQIFSRLTLVAFILLILSIGPITRYMYFIFPALSLLIGAVLFEWEPIQKKKKFSLSKLAFPWYAIMIILIIALQLDSTFFTRQKIFLNLPKRSWLYFADYQTDRSMLYQIDNYRIQEYTNIHLDPSKDKVLQLLDNRVYYLDIPSEFANTIAGGYFTNKADKNVTDVYQRIKADGFTHVIKLDAWGAHPVMRQELFNGFMDEYVSTIATEAGVTLYKLK